MLTFPKLLIRSLLIVAGAVLGDGLVSLGGALFGFNFAETIGDLMLVEVAGLFLIAGLIDFSSSLGATHVRKAVFGSKQEYSQSSHSVAQRRALVLVLAGTIMFVILIVIAILSSVSN